LQRPENVAAGFLTWPDYRSKSWPNAIRIEHHKYKTLVWHPPEEIVDDESIEFYASRRLRLKAIAAIMAAAAIHFHRAISLSLFRYGPPNSATTKPAILQNLAGPMMVAASIPSSPNYQKSRGAPH
jgi:hypothetical protein